MRCIGLVVVCSVCHAVTVSPVAEQAWRAYIRQVEERILQQHTKRDTYLATLNCDAQTRARLESQLLSGSVLITPVDGGTKAVAGGLLHHWRAAAFVPGTTARAMLQLLRDYDHLSQYYSPAVISSHLVAADTSGAIVAMRTKQKEIITVVLDSEFRVENTMDGDERGYEFSRSTHIWQVDNTGSYDERRRPEDDGDGLLWRLNSYWSFVQWRSGLLIECESLSLTRDVPAGVGWLITPIIRDLPRESLEFTIRATEKALQTKAKQEAER